MSTTLTSPLKPLPTLPTLPNLPGLQNLRQTMMMSTSSTTSTSTNLSSTTNSMNPANHPANANSNAPPPLSESQSRIHSLFTALHTMSTTTQSASLTSSTLSRRSRHLDSLTSPASETSALLAQASANLTATSNVLKDAREKFDTVADCEPAVERLFWGAREACREVAVHAERQGRGGVLPESMRRLIDGRPDGGIGGGKDHASSSYLRNKSNMNMSSSPLTEQELYAGADAMEIVRDAHAYFSKRQDWKSSKASLMDLERVHHVGVDAMGLLVTGHLTGAGAAVRRKVESGANASSVAGEKGRRSSTRATAAERAEETAAQTRDRLQEALQNRDLMKSIGEYEEYLPLSTRVVRELRAIFECLGGMPSNGTGLLLSSTSSQLPPPEPSLPPGGKIVRTEKAGSAHYTNLTMRPLKTGYPHLDSYGEARKAVAYASVDGYCRQLRNARKKAIERGGQGGSVGDSGIGAMGAMSAMTAVSSMGSKGAAPGGSAAHHANVDSAARDAVRCIEHTMVVVSGEKSVYRCVVSPSSSSSKEDEHGKSSIDAQYQKALIASYSYVASAAVDRLLDLIEYTFLREAGCAGNLGSVGDGVGGVGGGGAGAGGPGGPGGNGPGEAEIDIRTAASAAAAGLRIVDGVRMLGPSLSKLCEIGNLAGGTLLSTPANSPPDSTIASALCISLHRSTVKNCSKTLENLARSIQLDPLDGKKHRPADARVATVSSDVVHAIRVISPFVSAYKSVSKRRALPWDPNIGENSGEMDTFVRFLVKQLIISLQGKAQNYKHDGGVDAQAKSNLFMMNNTFYLLELLGPIASTNDDSGIELPPPPNPNEDGGGANYRIEAPWFKSKITKIFDSEKSKYLTHWEALNNHLTAVDDKELNYQNNKDVLSLESGRLLKSRFSGFIEDFERTYSVHRHFTVIDPTLREMLQRDIRRVFLLRYKAFYDKYSKIQFSKKNMENYLKYPPQNVDALIGQLFAMQ